MLVNEVIATFVAKHGAIENATEFDSQAWKLVVAMAEHIAKSSDHTCNNMLNR